MLEFNPEGIPLRLSRQGEMTLWVDETDEGQLKGSMFPTFFWLNSPFRCGSVSENASGMTEISYTVHFATPCQQFAMDIKAVIDEDGTITGHAETPTGPYELTGKKVREYRPY